MAGCLVQELVFIFFGFPRELQDLQPLEFLGERLEATVVGPAELVATAVILDEREEDCTRLPVQRREKATPRRAAHARF